MARILVLRDVCVMQVQMANIELNAAGMPRASQIGVSWPNGWFKTAMRYGAERAAAPIARKRATMATIGRFIQEA